MDGTIARSNTDFSKKRKPESLDDFRQIDASEKSKRHNVENESMTIDTLYRLLCPVEKIGSVLGKGGSIVSAIRAQTNAKIRVANRVPGADERVVIIYSHPVLDTSSQDDETAGNIDKEGKPVKLHCPAQSALFKVFDRLVEDDHPDKKGMVKSDEAGEITIRLLVPHNQVGCLIGKAGDVIQKLRSGTRANIRILGAQYLPACAMPSDELVQISGRSDDVWKALYEISTRLHQHPRKENPPINEIISASAQGSHLSGAVDQMPLHRTSMWPHDDTGPHVAPPARLVGAYRNELSKRAGIADMTEQFSLKVVCPAGKIGGVIGKGGTNVRQLEQQTGASIHVEDNAPDSSIRIVLISSKETLWDPISPTIEAMLQLQERVSEISDKGDVTTRLLVPSSKAGCLLGQGGQVINEMRKQTRADIRVCAKADKPSYASFNEELVQISGDQRCTRAALSEVVSRLRERILRDGSATLPPPADAPRRFSPFDGVPGAQSTAHYGYSSMKGFPSTFEEEKYRVPPIVSGYQSTRLPSAYESGVDRISDLHQDYGARARLYDPPSRSADYGSELYRSSEGASWSQHGRYEDPVREAPYSYISRSYRSFERD